jgi:anti-sigma factor RsiW
MDPAPEDEQRLVEYLLGRLPELEREQLEERLFDDEDLDERLLAASDDLIHAYLSGELPPHDRRQFESHFLVAPDHLQRLHFMRRLLAAANTPVQPRSVQRAGWWLAAAVVLMALGAILALLRDREAGQPSTATSSAPASASGQPMPSRPAASPGDDVLFVRVPPGRHPPVVVRVSEHTRLVQLQVAVDDTSPSFDATIHSADGAEIWRAEALAPPVGKLLVLQVPARLLGGEARGAYALRIVGESLRGDPPRVLEYRLQVEREDPGAR